MQQLRQLHSRRIAPKETPPWEVDAEPWRNMSHSEPNAVALNAGAAPDGLRQALILVGGRGTRLGALAEGTPKPLMAIKGDVRFLDYLLENIARCGFDEILLLAGHLGTQVEARYQGASVQSSRIAVVRETAPAGTAGALAHVADRLHDRFLMTNGDSFFDIDYLALAKSLGEEDVGALALRRIDDAARYGRVLCEHGRILAFREKDPEAGAALISGGVYVLRRSVIDWIDRQPCSLETDVFPQLAASQRLAGVECEGFFLDIGLPETLAEARATLPQRIERMKLYT
jgi:D-glycero-D-manno-heptose 1,7-bisphosphate phosphatase